jgi:hypothetical protein
LPGETGGVLGFYFQVCQDWQISRARRIAVTNQSTTFIRLVAAVLLLMLTSCATKPPLIPGIYTTTITEEDVISNDELGPVDRGFLPGKWELTLAEGDRRQL